jgi:hypothetical protein
MIGAKKTKTSMKSPRESHQNLAPGREKPETAPCRAPALD